MIFDDYGWGGPDLTQKGIDAFLSGYHIENSAYWNERLTGIYKKNKMILICIMNYI